MVTRILNGILIGLILVTTAWGQSPLDTAISYQGLLEDGTGPATGQYDFSFTLFDDALAGLPLGTTVFLEDVDVTNGIFSVELDFDEEVFDGSQPWMEILVRPGASTHPSDYVVLGPRQKISPAPYAIYSLSGGIVRSGQGEIPMDQLDGVQQASLGFVPFEYVFPNPPTVTVTGLEIDARSSHFIPMIGTTTTDGFELLLANPALEATVGRNYRFNWIATEQGDQSSAWYKDEDGDGYSDGTKAYGLSPPPGYFSGSELIRIGGDCDDTDRRIHPGAKEIWYDGIDQDCDGLSDYDYDKDGYDVYIYGGTDLEDLNPFIHPGAMELCNGVDDDCDGIVDEDCVDRDCSDEMVERFKEYVAECNNGGISKQCVLSAASLFEGTPCEEAITNLVGCSQFSDLCFVLGSYDCLYGHCPTEAARVFGALEDKDEDGFNHVQDCDDDNASVNPGATEIWYDGIDQDCDGKSDYDQDQDGYDSDAHGGLDCDDTDPTINPGAGDRCGDGIDQDCDGIDATCRDADKDGFLSDVDCHDLDPRINPGVAEIWYDGIDQDCDGADDYDQDGDGFPGVLVADGDLDCDDTNPDTYPGAPEIWYDGVDQDCDGGSDYDQDGDGVDRFPEGTDPIDTDPDVTSISQLDLDDDGYISVNYGGDDCDDSNRDINPGAAEIWYDGVDQDCDGESDYDQDGDGFDREPEGSDPDDTNPDIVPG